MSNSAAAPQLSLSLWSIRKGMYVTPDETLDRVKGLGISSVEVAGFFNDEAARLAGQLSQRTLRVCGITGPALRENRHSRFYITWALTYLPLFNARAFNLHTDPRGFAEFSRDSLVRLVIEIARELEKCSITVGYHCYPHDFDSTGGDSFMSQLFSAPGVPQNLGLQLDTYWLHFGSTDPSVYAPFPVSSVHLNERDEAGIARILGTDEQRCSQYIRSLVARNNPPANWILENESADRADDEPTDDDVLQACIEGWAAYWETLVNSPAAKT